MHLFRLTRSPRFRLSRTVFHDFRKREIIPAPRAFATRETRGSTGLTLGSLPHALTSFGQLRNSRSLSPLKRFGELVCSAGFRFVFAFGECPTGTPLISAPYKPTHFETCQINMRKGHPRGMTFSHAIPARFETVPQTSLRHSENARSSLRYTFHATSIGVRTTVVVCTCFG